MKMSKTLILESTGEQLKAKGYRKCTKEKYQEYKKNSDYLTAVADEGGYYYKKKSTTPKPDPKKEIYLFVKKNSKVMPINNNSNTFLCSKNKLESYI
jgi:hypothetical protein